MTKQPHNFLRGLNLIHLYNCNDLSAEAEAAFTLRDKIMEEWREASADSGTTIWIIAHARCFGQEVSDIDLLILGKCGPGTFFQPVSAVPDGRGGSFWPDTIGALSFALTIEIKDHNPGRIAFSGNRVMVDYEGRKHDVTAQSEKQKFAVKNYVQHNGLRPPWVRNLIFLRNALPHEIPSTASNVIGANLTLTNLLTAAARVSAPRWDDSGCYLDDFQYADSPEDMAALFTQEIRLTELDRRRMERLSATEAKKVVTEQRLGDILGNRLLLVRGGAGCGKTVLLLQLARFLYEGRSARVLILTYNKALVADIRRILDVSGLSRDIGERAISVQTVHAYLCAACAAVGVPLQATLTGGVSPEVAVGANTDDFGENYERQKRLTLEYFQSGALTEADVAHQKAVGVPAFSYDFAFVDEGQDWPDEERDLLIRLFSHRNLVVAEGREQLIRRQTATEWRGALNLVDVHILQRDQCLRMKANLSRFVPAFASALGIDYPVSATNTDAVGGRVLIVEGDYFATPEIDRELTETNRRAGNRAIDMLFCVPPSLVRRGEDGIPASEPANVFQQWGHLVWDGVSPDARNCFPVNADQRRIVQYDSCRGLEGWTVVNFALDALYDHKARLASEQGRSPDEQRDYAGLWTLIPLTRAIDTLVLNISASDSPVRRALEKVHHTHRDFIQWIRL